MLKISLCMIVKNEEHNLRRCLGSVQGYVDEIVVIDTGSTDNTVSIAREFAALICQAPWEDDFSKARNLALERAGGDWILIMDADEELPLSTSKQLRTLADQPDVEAWTFSIISLEKVGDAESGTKHPGLRMFRNRPDYRFEGIVHEQIMPSILRSGKKEGNVLVKHSNLVIFHYGYIDSVRRQKATQRNIRLLKKELERLPCNSYVNFNMAVSLHTLGLLEDALCYYKLAMQYAGAGPVGHKPVLYRNYASCLIDYGEFVRALELIDEGLALYPDYPELHYLKGQVYQETGLYDQSRKWYSQCLQFSNVSSDYVITQGVTGDLARENLARSCFMLGLYEETLSHLVELNRKKRVMTKELCRSLKELNMFRVSFFEEQLSLTPAQVIAVLFDAGEYKECLDYITRRHNHGSSPKWKEETMLYRLQCMNKLGIHISQGFARSIMIGGVRKTCEDLLRQLYIAKWTCNLEFVDNIEQFFRACGHIKVSPSRLETWRIIDLVLSAEGNDVLVDLPYCSDFRREALRVTNELLKLGKIEQAAIVVSLFVRQGAAGQLDFPRVLLEMGRILLDNGMVLQANNLLRIVCNHRFDHQKAGSGEITLSHREVVFELAKSYVLMEDYDNALRLMTRLVSRFPGVQEYAAYLLIALAGCEKEMAMALYKVKPDNTVLGLVFSSAGRIKKLQQANFEDNE